MLPVRREARDLESIAAAQLLHAITRCQIKAINTEVDFVAGRMRLLTIGKPFIRWRRHVEPMERATANRRLFGRVEDGVASEVVSWRLGVQGPRPQIELAASQDQARFAPGARNQDANA